MILILIFAEVLGKQEPQPTACCSRIIRSLTPRSQVFTV
jgi:hypothetical protein